jgi:hypothetical protein
MLLGVCCMLALANAIKTANSQEGSLDRVELAQETVMAQLDATADLQPCRHPNGTLMKCRFPYFLDEYQCLCCQWYDRNKVCVLWKEETVMAQLDATA